MSLPLVILSSIAFMADSIEATPHLWVDVSKRAAADETEEKKDTTTTKKPAAAAAAVDDKTTTNRFDNSVGFTTTKKATPKPTTTTTKKAVASKEPSAKPSAVKSSASLPTPSATLNPFLPPLVVPGASPSNTLSNSSSSSSPVPSSDSATSANNSGGVSGGAIGGIVAAIVIIIAGAVAYFVIRRKKINKNSMQNRSAKPDPFTMGYGSDQAFHSQPMQQQQPAYQHQYGVQNNSPTSPTSPTYYNNNSNMQFTDANNHIIAEPMMATATATAAATAAAAASTQYQPQQYQPQTNQQYQPQTNQQYQPQDNQQYQSQDNQQYQPAQMYEPNTSMDGHNNVASAIVPSVVVAGVAAGAGVSTNAPVTNNGGLLAPTQAGSVGVFHVAATYTPTLSDEIDIQTGDQVEVLVEYDDGWCQGINLSRGHAKGVFPKHCIDFASGASVASSIDRVKRVSSMYIA